MSPLTLNLLNLDHISTVSILPVNHLNSFPYYSAYSFRDCFLWQCMFLSKLISIGLKSDYLFLMFVADCYGSSCSERGKSEPNRKYSLCNFLLFSQTKNEQKFVYFQCLGSMITCFVKYG